MSVEEIINFIIVFLFFICATVAMLFFIIESCLCIFHAVHGSPIDGIEILSLIVISLIGGGVGLIWYMSDVL